MRCSEFLATGDVVSELRTAREFAQKFLNEGRQMAAETFSRKALHAWA